MKRFTALFTIAILLSSCNFTKDQEKEKILDTIVVGGGLMGSSTAWHLSEQGNTSVLLLEKQDSIYSQGSSLGEARIARSSNRGSDIWSYLNNRSVHESQKLINYLKNSDPSNSYNIDDLYTTSPVTYVGRMGIYDRLLTSLIRQKVDYEMAISPEEGKSKFDVLLPDSVLIQREYNVHSGTLNPQKLISYLHTAIEQKGNAVQYNSKVREIQYDPQNDRYELQVENTISGKISLFQANKVAIAAGPYTGKLLTNLAPYFDSLINPKRVFLAFLKINKGHYQTLAKDEKEKLLSFYPVINSSKGTRDGSFFSMIEYFDSDELPVIKIGGHFQRSEIEDLDSVWLNELSEEELEWSLSSTADYFKLLNLPIQKEDIEYIKGYSCVYSLTETEVPFVTPILNEDDSPNERFVVLGGMSGVGAKGAMTYGLIAADILHEKNRVDSLYNVVKTELGFERLKNRLVK